VECFRLSRVSELSDQSARDKSDIMIKVKTHAKNGLLLRDYQDRALRNHPHVVRNYKNIKNHESRKTTYAEEEEGLSITGNFRKVYDTISALISSHFAVFLLKKEQKRHFWGMFLSFFVHFEKYVTPDISFGVVTFIYGFLELEVVQTFQRNFLKH